MNIIQNLVNEMLASQPKQWSLFKNNQEALKMTQHKHFKVRGVEIVAQFNPVRVVSTMAKTDSKSIRKRNCFLCPKYLPKEQLRLPVLQDYQILCNPFPIFPHHLTIPTIHHTAQCILPRIKELLELAYLLPNFTLFYNGPQCGASAPDHAHFQAAPFGLMPIDKEADSFCSPIYQLKGATLCKLSRYLRNGFTIESESKDELVHLFILLYKYLPIREGEEEPMMNLFAHYGAGKIRLIIIPRKSHRPWQYRQEAGQEQFLSSPGAADIGGLFVTVREIDFERISPSILEDIYQQVCYDDSEIDKIALQFLIEQ